ncbi:transposase, partial [Arthrospira platensis SPKY1]|nr:transposase [Arthrospira platensis SPKY1]
SLVYPEAERITLVMDNLNTHTPGSLYETFSPERAKTLVDRFEWIYTPKHGSWLNMAEIEINVMIKQCLSRRIADFETAAAEIAAWETSRNRAHCAINWRFTADDAR